MSPTPPSLWSEERGRQHRVYWRNTLTGDIHTAGAALSVADGGLARLLSDFLLWKPVPPGSISRLVNSVAPLTRPLREEVVDPRAREQRLGDGPFTRVAADRRAPLPARTERFIHAG